MFGIEKIIDKLDDVLRFITNLKDCYFDRNIELNRENASLKKEVEILRSMVNKEGDSTAVKYKGAVYKIKETALIVNGDSYTEELTITCVKF